MKEIPKPVFSSNDDLFEHVQLLAQYGEKIVKQQKQAIDRLADTLKPADCAKRLSNTGRDKELAARLTIHDKMAMNPAMYAQLKEIFG